MGDFLKRVTARPTEIVEVAGEKVEVRGLSVGEMANLRKAHKGDEESLGTAVLCACCYVDGRPAFTPEIIQGVMPHFLAPLGPAIERVNGIIRGNSSATDGSSSSD